MKSAPPFPPLPKLFCDLNTLMDDGSYCGLHREQLAALQPTEGMKVFIWDWSDYELVIGGEARLERTEYGWLARLVDETWFEGKPDGGFKLP